MKRSQSGKDAQRWVNGDKEPSEKTFDQADISVGKDAWLSAEEKILSNQCVHYLEVTIASVGYLVQDDFRFIINGAKPVP